MAKIWERLRERLQLRYIGVCKCGSCHLVQYDQIAKAADLLEEAERVLKEARLYLEPPQAGTIIQNRVDALLTRIREEQQ